MLRVLYLSLFIRIYKYICAVYTVIYIRQEIFYSRKVDMVI
jgi:hypothetical protein